MLSCCLKLINSHHLNCEFHFEVKDPPKMFTLVTLSGSTVGMHFFSGKNPTCTIFKGSHLTAGRLLLKWWQSTGSKTLFVKSHIRELFSAQQNQMIAVKLQVSVLMNVLMAVCEVFTNINIRIPGKRSTLDLQCVHLLAMPAPSLE